MEIGICVCVCLCAAGVQCVGRTQGRTHLNRGKKAVAVALDDESKIRRWGRRQAAAGELAGMLVCNGDDDGEGARWKGRTADGRLIITRVRWTKWLCAMEQAD